MKGGYCEESDVKTQRKSIEINLRESIVRTSRSQRRGI